jgi:GNAT superfamily N-acetyltransferase
MLFADTSLAARIERTEATMLPAAVTHVRRGGGAGSDAFALELAGGVAAFTALGSPLNKVLGLGFAGVPTDEALDAVEDAYRARGVPVQVEISTLADPSVAALLTSRGYRLVGHENVLGRTLPLRHAPVHVAGVSVEPSPIDDVDAWIALVVRGFLSPDVQGVQPHEAFDGATLTQVMRDFVQLDDMHRYVVRRDGVALGGGAMRVHDGIAQLCGASTLPEHRRRGVQTTLLEARLDAASRAGCDLAIVTTQPGSTSQRNVQKQGFALLYARAVLVRTHDAQRSES